MKRYLIFFFLAAGLNAFAKISFKYTDGALTTLTAASLKSDGSFADTSAINRLNKLARQFIEINPDSTLHYGQESVALSRTIDYKAGLADGLLQTGHANYFKGRFVQAETEFDEAIRLYQTLGNKKGESDCYALYGRMYTMRAEYRLALHYFNKALGLYDAEKNKPEIADCYKNIGMVYFGQSKHSDALDYYYKALFIDINAHKKSATADIYNNIGDVLQNMGIYPKALEYYKKALAIAQENKDLLEIGTADENIGEVFLALKNYDGAIPYLFKSIKIAKKQDDKDGISYISADIGLCYAYKSQELQAIAYLRTALATSDKYKIYYDKAYVLICFATAYNLQKKYEMSYRYAVDGQKLAVKLGNIWYRANAIAELNKAMAGLGKYKEAYKLSRKYNDLKDSLNNNESIQKLTSYNLEYDFAAKQNRLARQQQEREGLDLQKIKQERLNFLFFMILSILSVISALYYRGRSRQRKINNFLSMQAQKLNESNNLKDRLIAILAHDLRAPICTLRGVFDLFEDDSITYEQFLAIIPQAVKKLDYTSEFLDTLLYWINSQMENFESSSTNFSIKDIIHKKIINYHELAGAKGVNLVENVPEDLVVSADQNSVRIVIRNLLTNAIKFTKCDDTICISAAKQDDDLVLVTIQDSGTGMSEAQLNKLFKSKVDSMIGTNNESGTGLGLFFCKDLIEKCHGTIWATSQPGKGTQFSFLLPLSPSL